MKIENVILWDNGATEWYTYAADEANAANRIKLEDAMKADFSETVSITRIALDGEGTATKPYLIKTAEDLKNLAKLVNTGYNFEGKYIMQTADIDLKSEEWTPIGTSVIPFRGVYDGKNFKISNLKITKPTQFLGLFGYVESGFTAEAGLANINLDGKIELASAINGGGIGGLCGWLYKDSVDIGNQVTEDPEGKYAKSLFAVNCNVDVDVTVEAAGNQPRVGGVFGYAFCATVDNVVNNGDVKVNSTSTV